MLVLSRKQNQEIIIGDNVKITILKMKGNTVRIGIEAPRDVCVRRGELPKLESKKVNVPASTPDESNQESEAEFTVVFSNTNEAIAATADVIPFEQQRTTQSKKQTPTANNRLGDSTETSQSVQFHGKLPTSFQHNRLKEIVSRLTASSSDSESEG